MTLDSKTDIFNFIPAVDLLGGQVVRLMQGRYEDSTVYGDNPEQPIYEFIKAGATLIHIVDLDAARDGNRKVNAAAIQKIRTAASSAAVRLEIGGGVRNLEIVDHYLSAGMDRVIIGTAAVRNPDFVKAAISRHGPEKIIVGVDAKDGEVKVSGWEEGSGRKTIEFLNEIYAYCGVRETIFTDIARDGALSGPPIETLKNVLNQTELRVVASGGVASLEDIQSLLSLKHPRLVGAISGRAIYENKLNVAEAVQLCRRSNSI